MGRNIIPRSTSTLMMVHTLVPERSSQESPSQVSCPASPGLGTVWNLQTSFPVRTSKARTSPLGPFDGNSWTSDPVMTKSLEMVGGEVESYCPFGHLSATLTRRLTTPPWLKPLQGFRVRVSKAKRRAPC